MAVTLMSPAVDAYLERVTPARQGLLAQLEKEARRSDFPIIGPLVGRVLYQYATLIKARRIFELGSGFGYSAIWFTMAMGKGGEIHLTEGDPENCVRAERNLRQARTKSRALIHQGDALGHLALTKGKFDIILNDIDKNAYPDVVRPAVAKLRVGGLLITDNAFWDGKALKPGGDKNTRGVKRYTQMVYAHPQLWTTILPIRDGVAVSVKIK